MKGKASLKSNWRILIWPGLIQALLPTVLSAATVVWTYDTGSKIRSSPALGPDGTIYIGADSGFLAITNTGSAPVVKWSLPVWLSGSPAIAADGTIYFTGYYGLYAVSPGGTPQWTNFASGGEGTPAIALDGTIYFSDYYGVHAVSPQGQQKWIGNPGGRYGGSPVIGPDGTIYVSSADSRQLYAYDSVGNLKWARGIGYGSEDSLTIGAEGVIYTAVGPLVALSPDGAQMWETTDYYDFFSSSAVGTNGTIYLGDDYRSTLNAIASGGSVLWQTPFLFFGTNSAPAAPAIDTAGILYYCASNSVFAINPNGQILWAVTSPELPDGFFVSTSPSIDTSGTIYAAVNKKLYAIAGTNALANSPWPMYRQNARHTGDAERPVLKDPSWTANSGFRAQLYSQLGRRTTIEASTNLVDWDSVTDVWISSVPLLVSDPAATNAAMRLYRAVEH